MSLLRCYTDKSNTCDFQGEYGRIEEGFER